MTFFVVPNLLQKAVVATQSSLESQLQKLLDRVNVLTTTVEKYVRIPDKPEHMHRVHEVEEEAEGEKTEVEGDKEQAEKLHKISEKQIQKVLDGLITARQLEVYLRYFS
jgi:hypothetical protein